MFDGIYVLENAASIVARNKNDRVLFKYGKNYGSFSAFRSHRMTDGERQFCIMMFQKLLPASATGEKTRELDDFFNYLTTSDVYCS